MLAGFFGAYRDPFNRSFSSLYILPVSCRQPLIPLGGGVGPLGGGQVLAAVGKYPRFLQSLAVELDQLDDVGAGGGILGGGAGHIREEEQYAGVVEAVPPLVQHHGGAPVLHVLPAEQLLFPRPLVADADALGGDGQAAPPLTDDGLDARRVEEGTARQHEEGLGEIAGGVGEGKDQGEGGDHQHDGGDHRLGGGVAEGEALGVLFNFHGS